ncbi:alpha/beta fold hydrolase [Klebsiella michiganensis]|nr:alpha/beta fold hydrolase [Klebsiella michiganensis]
METVRRTLGLGQVHLLGHSWGGWLAIEVALHHPGAIRSLILENTVADMPHLVQELNRLRGALGPETVAMMQRYEALGWLDHPAYQAAITLLNYRHVCRLDVWYQSRLSARLGTGIWARISPCRGRTNSSIPVI